MVKKKKISDTPIIMLTAMDSFAHKKKGYNLGIDEYLTKPIDYEELTWHIEAILRRYKINSEREIIIGNTIISEDFTRYLQGSFLTAPFLKKAEKNLFYSQI